MIFSNKIMFIIVQKIYRKLPVSGSFLLEGLRAIYAFLPIYER